MLRKGDKFGLRQGNIELALEVTEVLQRGRFVIKLKGVHNLTPPPEITKLTKEERTKDGIQLAGSDN